MAKASKKNMNSKRRGIRLLTVLGSAVLLFALLGILLIQKNSDADSEANIKLMQQASAKRDVNICDQIKGPIKETNFNTNRNHTDEPVGAAAYYRAMDEAQAKRQCRFGVQQNIDLQEQLKRENN